MSAPHDRLGVFLVEPAHDQTLRATRARVQQAFIDADGTVGPSAWYRARHEMFERLLELATYSRVSQTDGTGSVAALVVTVDGRQHGRWDAADPIERRKLVRKHVNRIADPILRAAVDAALAHPAAAHTGLWIETENALPPEPATVATDDDIDPEEVARALDAYIAYADWRWRRDEPTESSYHAYLCELTDDDAHHAAESWHGVDLEDVDAVVRASEQAVGRSRLHAIACAEETTIATVDALEELCGRIDVPSLARNIYSVPQAQQLLTWVDMQPESPARDVVLPPLRRTVERRNAFAIGFHTS